MFIYIYFLPCITRMLHASDACLSFLMLHIIPLLLYQTHVVHALTMRYMHVLLYTVYTIARYHVTLASLCLNTKTFLIHENIGST